VRYYARGNGGALPQVRDAEHAAVADAGQPQKQEQKQRKAQGEAPVSKVFCCGLEWQVDDQQAMLPVQQGCFAAMIYQISYATQTKAPSMPSRVPSMPYHRAMQAHLLMTPVLLPTL
jgi:hypothetical protein